MSTRPVGVLLWIAFAVLIAVALWILLAACGLAWPGGRPMLVFCQEGIAAREVDPALVAEQERERALQRSVRMSFHPRRDLLALRTPGRKCRERRGTSAGL